MKDTEVLSLNGGVGLGEVKGDQLVVSESYSFYLVEVEWKVRC